MKKILILILSLFMMVGLFANDPETPTPTTTSTSFKVTTSVAGINEMGITTAKVTDANSGIPTSGLFTKLTIGGTGGSEPDTNGAVTFDAYISTRSNNRKGYTVTLSATPMTSTTGTEGNTVTATINYTVSVAAGPSPLADGGSYTTSPTSNPVEVIKISSLPAVDVQSRQISLTVDMADYTSAVEGTYIGTVTFNYVAN